MDRFDIMTFETRSILFCLCVQIGKWWKVVQKGCEMGRQGTVGHTDCSDFKFQQTFSPSKSEKMVCEDKILPNMSNPLVDVFLAFGLLACFPTWRTQTKHMTWLHIGVDEIHYYRVPHIIFCPDQKLFA